MNNYKYEANVNELLNILINNIYTNKEIFLRELISNSSDAINKLKLYNDNNFFIKIILDFEKKSIIIYDNGIGMNKDDLINNIGIIANSDTKKYKDLYNNNNLIGNFGIGFYSSFLVSSKVIILTKKDYYSYYKWFSDSIEYYNIEELDINDYENSDIINNEFIKDFNRGTIIECFLKEDCYDFINENKIKDIILKHNQFIKYPIYLNNEILNNNKTIWNTNYKELTKEDCYEFYKYFYKQNDNPLEYNLIYGEGKINYKGIIYIPKENIVNMFEKNKQNNIKLYVKNILITENSNEICPSWLSFLMGLIDIDDIPLNISRETLQQNENILLLKKQFIKKSVDFFKDIMVNNYELYQNFFYKYGKFIKFGIRDDDNDTIKDKLKELLLYKSLKTDENKLLTLKEYIDTLNDIEKDKKIIYYIINDNYNNIIISPYLEKFKKKNYNVLFMTEPVDEYLMEVFTEYNDYKFICIGKGVLYLNDTDEEKELYEKKSEEYKDLCEYIKSLYKNILTVKISLYLEQSPCIIYSAEYGTSANMEKILKAQTLLTHTDNMNTLMYYKNLELNPNHSIIKKLKNNYDNNNIEYCNNILNMLYNTSLLHSGYNIQLDYKYINNIYNLMNNI